MNKMQCIFVEFDNISLICTGNGQLALMGYKSTITQPNCSSIRQQKRIKKDVVNKSELSFFLGDPLHCMATIIYFPGA